MKRVHVLALLLAFFVLQRRASAQDECAPPSGAAATRATSLFQRAQSLLDEGNSAEAVQLLQEVLQIHESPNVRLVLARALTLDGRATEAWDSYRRTEEHASRCGDRYAQAGASALQERSGVARQIGLLRVVSSTPNAAIEIRDGGAVPRNARSGELVPVQPGLVEVRVEDAGYSEWQEVVRVEAGTTREIDARLRATTSVPSPTVAAQEIVNHEEQSALAPPVERERTGWRGAAIGTGVLAVAALAMTVVSFVQSNGIFSDAEAQCSPTLCPGTDAFAADLERGQRWERAGVGLAISTGVLAITSIGLGVAALKNPYVEVE